MHGSKTPVPFSKFAELPVSKFVEPTNLDKKKVKIYHPKNPMRNTNTNLDVVL
jgi:hypothetical protein